MLPWLSHYLAATVATCPRQLTSFHALPPPTHPRAEFVEVFALAFSSLPLRELRELQKSNMPGAGLEEKDLLAACPIIYGERCASPPRWQRPSVRARVCRCSTSMSRWAGWGGQLDLHAMQLALACPVGCRHGPRAMLHAIA